MGEGLPNESEYESVRKAKNAIRDFGSSVVNSVNPGANIEIELYGTADIARIVGKIVGDALAMAHKVFVLLGPGILKCGGRRGEG